jgi:hypothetical protein
LPDNELSFWAWGGGEVGRFNPSERGRGAELKRQLARAAIWGMQAIREVDPMSRFGLAEPMRDRTVIPSPIVSRQ